MRKIISIITLIAMTYALSACGKNWLADFAF